MTRERARALLGRGIGEGVFPGAAAAWGDPDGYTAVLAGRFTYAPDAPVVDETALFDLASLTKVVATTRRIQVLVQEGRLDLDEPIARHLPSFEGGDRSGVTVRHLLAHTSGLPACRRYEERTLDAAQALAMALSEPLEAPPGTRTLYCDVGFVVLGHLAAMLGRPIEFDLPEGFCFCPPAERWPRCLPTGPTEAWRRRLWADRSPRPEHEGFLQGEVHDPRAALFGGVAGHAGLFGSLSAVADWAQERLSALDDPVEREWARPHSPDGKRGLGWDLDPGGLASLVPGLFGHTGFTGTLVALDPARRRFIVLLTNRVHPSAESLAIRDFRREFVQEVWG